MKRYNEEYDEYEDVLPLYEFILRRVKDEES